MDRTVLAAALAIGLAACNLHSEAPSIEDRPAVRSVVISPDPATVRPGQRVQFRAVVTGDGPVPSGVIWQHTCVAGCFEQGTLSEDGLYTAPSHSTGGTFEISAQSVTLQAKAAVRMALYPSSFTLTPSDAVVRLGDEVRFQANWNGQTDLPFTWSCQHGTIDASGRYRAPDTFALTPSSYTIRDTVVVELPATGEQLTATIQLQFRPPFLATSSGPAAAGEVLAILGTGLLAEPARAFTTEVLFPDGGGGFVRVPAQGTATRLEVVVPAAAASGALFVEFSGGTLPAARSNPLTFERRAALRLHPARTELAAGESTAIAVAVLGGAGPVPLTFETDLGAVAGATYTAPPGLTGPATAHVKACLTGTSSCAGVTLALRPVRAEPAAPVVASGGALQLELVGVAGPVTFQLVAGGGSVGADGLYRAPTALAEGGPAWIMASAGGVSVPIQVGVTGQVPGLVDRLTEPGPAAPGPLTDGVAWGAAAEAVALAGDRAYLLQSTLAGPPRRWIDAYDLADPARPGWLGSVEVRGGTTRSFRIAGGLLLRESSSTGDGLGEVRSIDAYELSGPIPRQVGSAQERYLPATYLSAPASLDERAAYLFADDDPPGPSQSLRVFPIAGGAFGPAVTRPLALPPDGFRERYRRRVAAAAEGRAYLTYQTSGRDQLGAWDVTADPARFLGSVVLTRSTLFGALKGRHLVISFDCFDLVPEVPVQVTCTAEDLASPDFGAEGLLSYTPRGAAGLELTDRRPAGGPRPVPPLARELLQLRLLATALHGGVLYAVGERYPGEWFLSAWDAAASPPAYRWSTQLSALPTALAAGDGFLRVGTATELQVWSLSDPLAPAKLAATPLDVAVLAVDGATTWVGTLGGALVAVDLTAPAAPATLGRISFGAPARALRRLGPGLLVAGVATPDGASGDLVVVDGSIPAAPAFLGWAGLAAPALDVALDGPLALVATTVELITVDLSDPALPRPLVGLAIPPSLATDASGSRRGAAHLGLGGGLAWLTIPGPELADWRLQGFDVARPRWPRLVSDTSLEQLGLRPEGLLVEGTRALGLEFHLGADPWPVAEGDLSLPRNVLRTLPQPAAPRMLTPP